MKHESEPHLDEGVNLGVYLSLLALTGATLGASLFNHTGRLMAVSIALIIASVKASLIAYYFMGLRRERALILLFVAVGFVAVVTLLLGIMPDMTFARF
jgi:caa(3)-type oxidase subunit IV